MEKLYMLSYPRSGSNWISYYMEIACNLKTTGVSSDYTCPCVKSNHRQDTFIMKSHGHRQHELDKMRKSGRLLFLLRDFKECIVRHREIKDDIFKTMDDMQGVISRPDKCDYIKILRYFDEYPNDKLLVYYRDLIKNPERVFGKISEFWGQDNKNIKDFINNLDNHKKYSIANYKKISYSATSGSTPLFHQKKFSTEKIVELNSRIKERYPILYKKYLEEFKVV